MVGQEWHSQAELRGPLMVMRHLTLLMKKKNVTIFDVVLQMLPCLFPPSISLYGYIKLHFKNEETEESKISPVVSKR